MEPKVLESFASFARGKAVEDKKMSETFGKRYKANPTISCYNNKEGTLVFRSFSLGARIAEYVEALDKGLTVGVLTLIGKAREQHTYRSVLEAEVSIADYLSEGS